ncbi:MAG: hypothetical protein WBW16_12220 [Bacteroidota bacterium]
MTFLNINLGKVGCKLAERMGGNNGIRVDRSGPMKPYLDLSCGSDANDVADGVAVNVAMVAEA